LTAQQEYGLELDKKNAKIDGTITISQDITVTYPEEGTIRWSGSAFEGWNGFEWIPLSEKNIGQITDIDGNIYRTYQIGNQTWMIDNLKVTRYNDGTPISQNINDWTGVTIGIWDYYNSDPNLDLDLGKLYNWYAVETGKLCPIGWKVPEHSQWSTINFQLGTTAAGGKMKKRGIDFWNSPNNGATNESGFSAKGAGRRNGITSDELNLRAYWWSSTEGTSGNGAQSITISHNSDNLNVSTISPKHYGYSIRCILD
jgi:uncharacterized protein (TIGR02145 family)